MVMLPMTLGDL